MKTARLFLFFFAVSFFAAPLSFGDELRESAKTLRNVDPGALQEERWRVLERRYRARINERGRDPALLYNFAVFLETWGRASADQKRLEEAVHFFQRTGAEFPKSELAPTALFQAGTLLRGRLNETQSGEKLLRELVERYPSHEKAYLARSALAAGVVSGPVRILAARRVGKRLVVVLDPGHGGDDLGAVGRAGLREKDINLIVAFDLAERLREQHGVRVLLTRSSDRFVPLAARTALANRAEADLFVSIHANASPGKNRSGFEVYYLSSSESDAAQLLAERENAQAGQSIDQLSLLIGDLIQRGKSPASVRSAKLVYRSVVNELKGDWPTLRAGGVRAAPFYVLVGAHMPAILVEMLYVDHPSDAALLTNRKFRTDLSGALARAIYRAAVKGRGEWK